MITEDYVSFEIAKLLKEKGFDGECDLFGRTDEPELIIREAAKIAYNQGIDDECVIIPTLQMAMKWLREVHKLHIILDIHWLYFANQNGWMYTISRILENGNEYVDSRGDENDKNFYPTYEEACEAAIKYCHEHNLI